VGETDRVGVVVVTHGRLAVELVNAAEMIAGDLPHVTAVSIGWHDDVEVARQQIQRALGRVGGSGGTLILTDMFGGTPSNLSIPFAEPGRVEVVTGVNLPMLLKLARADRSADLLALARAVRDAGRDAIWVASELLRPEPRAPSSEWSR
jgi:PTS system mannose-specific IIA component